MGLGDGSVGAETGTQLGSITCYVPVSSPKRIIIYVRIGRRVERPTDRAHIVILPWHRRSSYEPDAPARGVPQSPRWRVGLVCARMRNFLAGVIGRNCGHLGRIAKFRLPRRDHAVLWPRVPVPAHSSTCRCGRDFMSVDSMSIRPECLTMLGPFGSAALRSFASLILNSESVLPSWADW